MSRLPYKVSSPRSANLIDAQPQRQTSADGTRWVISRNVKVQITGSGANGWRSTYNAMRKYWLKERRDGKAVLVRWTFDRALAMAWIAEVQS